MKYTLALLVLASVMFAGCSDSDVASIGVAEAQSKDAKHCGLIGSWIGFYPGTEVAWWTSTADGPNPVRGTNNLEVPGYPIKLPDPETGEPAFPDAQKASVLRGEWQRLDGRTFGGSVVGIVVDSKGNTLYTVKFSGTNTLDPGCDSMTVDGGLEFYLAGVNPLTGEPFLDLPTEPHKGYRIH